jgi:hypothetical protein
MRLPSGRRLSYPFPRLEPGKYDQKVVVFKDNSGGKFVDCRNGEGSWPGLWIENAVQAVARDILVAAMQRLEAAGYPIVMHIHDEIVVEVPIGFGSEEELLQIMTVVPSWAKDLPFNAKVRSGLRFCKTKSDQISEAPAVEAHESDTAPAVEAAPWEDQPSDIPLPPLAPETPEQTSWQDEPGAYQASGSGSPRYASGEREWGETVAEYIYKDQFGRPYLKVARTSKKQFPQYHLKAIVGSKGRQKVVKSHTGSLSCSPMSLNRSALCTTSRGFTCSKARKTPTMARRWASLRRRIAKVLKAGRMTWSRGSSAARW